MSLQREGVGSGGSFDMFTEEGFECLCNNCTLLQTL